MIIACALFLDKPAPTIHLSDFFLLGHDMDNY
jgi:hypothetical protein